MVSMSPAAQLPSQPCSHLQLRPALLLAALVEVPGLFVELLGDEATGRHCNTQDFLMAMKSSRKIHQLSKK